jgi:hypothetical protein
VARVRTAVPVRAASRPPSGARPVRGRGTRVCTVFTAQGTLNESDLAIPMIGSCEASLRHGSVDGRHSGLAGFSTTTCRVNERGPRADARARPHGILVLAAIPIDNRAVEITIHKIENGRFGDCLQRTTPQLTGTSLCRRP